MAVAALVALQAIETSFWEFCDHYVELAKGRGYAEEDSPGRRSAVATLTLALRAYLRLFAPFLPYITEEVWSWRFSGEGREGSVHTSPWPGPEETGAVADPEAVETFEAAVELIGRIWGAKTVGSRGPKWPVESLTVRGTARARAALAPALGDVLLAGTVRADGATLEDGAAPEGQRFEVEVVLAEEKEE